MPIGAPIARVPVATVAMNAARLTDVKVDEARRRFRRAAALSHPDRGGDAEAFVAAAREFEAAKKRVRDDRRGHDLETVLVAAGTATLIVMTKSLALMALLATYAFLDDTPKRAITEPEPVLLGPSTTRASPWEAFARLLRESRAAFARRLRLRWA